MLNSTAIFSARRTIMLTVRQPNWASWIRTSVMQGSKPCALPLGDSPKIDKGGYRDSNPGPPEPQSGALTNCAIPTTACLKGFEPPTHGLEGRCSIQLSYRLILISPFQKALRISTEKRVMGIEPTYPAWKAGVLPLNYTRRVYRGDRIRTCDLLVPNQAL